MMLRHDEMPYMSTPLARQNDQAVVVALREHVVGQLDDERDTLAHPRVVERGVVVVQHRDEVQRRVVVDVEVVIGLVAADAADVLDHQTALFDRRG